MKSKRKLSLQLFINTFVVMALIISVIMIIQYLFFNELYENYKTNKVRNKINNLTYIIENDDINLVEYRSIEDDFMFSHNTYISVTDESGNDYTKKLVNNQNWYTVKAITEDNIYISFTISEYNLYANLQMTPYDNQDYQDELLAIGDEYNIVFDYIGYDVVYVHLITDYKEFVIEGDTLINVASVTIKEIEVATEAEINQYLFHDYFYSQGIVEGAVMISDIETFDAVDVIEINKEAYSKDGEILYIKAIISLVNVDDAAAALMSYFPYFLTFALLCSLIISFIYSKRVSNPIVKISDISNEMAKLNFDKKVDDTRNNEIGLLGKNLNCLADNLQNALAELKDANVQLKEDIKIKKEQEKVRKEFVANVSHELKTPLGVIRCYTESLKDNIITNPEKEYYDDILLEVEKMTRLVMEMLELSKVESGNLKLNKTVLDIKNIIADNIILHQMTAENRGISVTVNGELPKIIADEEKIDSAISNILLNAVTYGEKSSEVKIMGKVNHNICRVSIVNICEGIDKNEAKKFFERFYVGDKSRHEGSTGLGLPICRAIFEAHGFYYGIDSNGETITVWFEYSANT